MACRLVLFVGTVVVAAVLASVAAPANVTVNCAGLQAALNAANAGDVITLNGVCTTQSFTLKTGVAITLQGDPSNGADGFDGGADANTRILTGQDVGATTIRLLSFDHGTSNGKGGAIFLSGNVAPTIEDSSFTSNSASGEGGAVNIGQSSTTTGGITVHRNSFDGNATSQDGGGLWLDANGPFTISDNTFGSTSPNTATNVGGGFGVRALGTGVISGNTVSSNSTLSQGGGAYIQLVRSGVTPFAKSQLDLADLDILDNDFLGNTASARGGGLQLDFVVNQPVVAKASQAVQVPVLATVDQTGNTFDSNSTSATGLGGGESILGPPTGGIAAALVMQPVTGNFVVTSTNDRFTNNDAGSGGGGGLLLTSFDNLIFTGRNLDAAGNEIPSGPGAGILAYSSNLTLQDSTVAGNTGGPQISPSATGSDLALTNSIVFGANTNVDGVGSGFATATATFTDLCASGAPFSGSGNICADPLLVNPAPGTADVHETASSPTIDAGSNALVPADLTTDYEGNPRIIGSAVDMGADEFQPVTAVQLLSLRAGRIRKGVLLRWRMANEVGLLGYNLYRQRGVHRLRLNKAIIPARGGVAARSYSFLDRKAPRTRRPLTYWLQIVGADGSRVWRVTRAQ